MHGSPPDSDPTPRWCEDARFVRALAGRLVADVDLADDLAQDAWVQALRSPRPRGSVRGWLRAIVRNLAVSQHRRDTRRAAHERRAGAGEHAEDPRAVLARLEAQELLVAAVRALDEPYRAAIVMRWFDGLSPREIAARTGQPVRTVHTRLQRALAQLRARLADRDPRWPALLLTTVPIRAGAAALAMTTTKLTVLGGACLVALVGFGWDHFAAGADSPPPAVATRTAGVPAASVPAQAPGAGGDRETAAPSGPAVEPAAGEVATEAQPWVVTGLLVDLGGHPLAGIGVSLTAFFGGKPVAVAVTDNGGAFSFSLPDVLGGNVDVDDDAWATVYRPVLWGNRDVGELLVVAGPAAPVEGRVTDEFGEPIEGVRVSVSGKLPPRAAFARSLERATPGEWQATTDSDGAFELTRAPLLPDPRVSASANGYRSLHEPLAARQRLHLVLHRAPVITGRVVDDQGKPVAAAVFCHPAGTMSGPDGRFELDVGNVQSPWIVAALQGHLPARLKCEFGPPTDPSSWPQPLELRLGGSTLAISGRALASDGTPLQSPQVRLLDAECLVPGNELSSVEFLARVSSQVNDNGAEFMESGFGGGEHGAFSIGGLQVRDYRLALEHRPTLQWLETGPIRAGSTDVELRLPAEPLWPRVAGVVVDRRGAPVLEASVWLEREDSATGTTRNTDGLTTDANGAFEHGAVARAARHVCVQTPGIAHPTRFELATLGDVARLRLVAPVRTSARVETSRRADAAAFLDVAGRPIAATITQGNAAWGAFDVPLTAGRSEVVTVPDDAATLVLRREGAEVARIQVDLRPGDVQVLRVD